VFYRYSHGITIEQFISLSVSVQRLSIHATVVSPSKLFVKLRQLPPHEKRPLFEDMYFLVSEIANSALNFTRRKVCFLPIERYQECRGCWLKYRFLVLLDLSLFGGTLCGANERMQYRSSLFLVSVDRYGLHLAPCEI
jgi:hypothetical protein